MQPFFCSSKKSAAAPLLRRALKYWCNRSRSCRQYSKSRPPPPPPPPPLGGGRGGKWHAPETLATPPRRSRFAPRGRGARRCWLGRAGTPWARVPGVQFFLGAPARARESNRRLNPSFETRKRATGRAVAPSPLPILHGCSALRVMIIPLEEGHGASALGSNVGALLPFASPVFSNF